MPPGFTPISATFVGVDTGWVLGTAPCTHRPCTSILRTTDGGRSWTGIPAPRAALDPPRRGTAADGVAVLRFADRRDGWAASGGLYATHDGGAHWHREQLGRTGSVVAALQTGGGFACAVVADCASGCARTIRVYATRVGSDAWRPVSPAVTPGTDDLVVHGRDWFLPVRGAVLHGRGPAPADRRGNPCPAVGGAAVSPQLAVADAEHLDALCEGTAAAGTARYQLYGTTDGGRHRTRSGPAHHGPTAVYGVADNGRGVLVVAAASGASVLLRTADGGAHLTRARVSAPAGGVAWADLGFTTPQRGIVVLEHTALCLSTDAGRSWHRVRF